jgi:methylated-DNA-protein-cysteine methyltransferase-like protein
MSDISKLVVELISAIPEGRIASYGQIAIMAGNPGASRQVSRLLHSMSDKYNLPWHRVVNSEGRISLKGEAEIIQKGLLESEGVEFDLNGSIDMKRYGI